MNADQICVHPRNLRQRLHRDWSQLFSMGSFDKFLTKVFGSSNQRFLKSIAPVVEKINSLEPSIKALSYFHPRRRTALSNERLQSVVGVKSEYEERTRV